MKLQDLYQEAIRIGRENDPRPKDEVEELLSRRKEEYSKLSPDKKKFFDQDLLWNPYTDTRLFSKNPQRDVKNIMVGIDVEVGEVLLFDRLRKELDLDCLISHHPEGSAYANFYEVMDLQVELLRQAGISLSASQQSLKERKQQVQRRVLPANFLRPIDACQLLDVDFLCIHTPADNCVHQFLKRYFEEKKPGKLYQVIDLLLEIPEYQEAQRNNFGPRILCGDSDSRVHKIFLEMTGGTEPHKDIYKSLVAQGYDTIVSMHLSEEHFKSARDSKLNVVIAGHMSSDTLGLNLLLDEVEKKSPLNFINCSGFRRFRHR